MMESFEDRLRRFLEHEDEAPVTLLVWAQNLLLPQVRVAKDKRLDNLIFLSTHGFIQTFSEKALGRKGQEATNYFLQSFMDEKEQNRKFSHVSNELHEMRNVMAHQLFSSRTHHIVLDYVMNEGWRRDNAMIHINPDVYANQFIAAIDGGRLWQWKNFVTHEQRIKQKYLFICDWLDLPKKDPIRIAVDQLAALTGLNDIRKAASAIDAQINMRYNL